MICRHCQHANPQQARFCIHCGKSIQMICSHCGTENPPHANFCLQCGQRFAEKAAGTPTHENGDMLRKFIPESFAEKLDAARAAGSMEGERRVVTMLFCDVKGSTNLAEQLDPEDWTELMNQAFECLIRPVYRYEGTVARLMGDAILAFFGAPIAHEDDPQRAVLAGLDILEAVQPLRENVRRRYGKEFNVRVGIHTGLVVVGAVGSNLRMEYTAMGDAANLAARMEQTAAPGTVQISGSTQKLVAGQFETEELPLIDVKGKQEPVSAFRVVAMKSEPTLQNPQAGVNSKLISREVELGMLRQSVQDLQQGRGGIIVVIGEAGLGKSRLITELHEQLGASDIGDVPWWVEANGVPYDTAHPYGLVQQQMRHVLRSTADLSLSTVGMDSTTSMPRLAPELQGLLSKVAGLLHIHGEALEVPSVDPKDGGRIEGEAFQRELFDAMYAYWMAEAEQRPIVMVFDDVHWADPASVELLLHMLKLSDAAPVLFVCAMRPYRESPGWRLKTAGETDFPHRYAEIQLGPLDSRSSQILVHEILAETDLPRKLVDLILDKAEGNPFFVGEVIHTLIDQGVVMRDPSNGGWRVTKEVDELLIPDSLQALLMARIDRLEHEVRGTLQLASVIGRSFYYRILGRIAEQEHGLDRHLNILQRVELIHESARVPELEYAFRHELTREAAYRSILRRERRRYHKKVAQALEELFPNRLEELAPRLGYHHEQAEMFEKAVQYYRMAGDISARLYANSEAIDHYTRALNLGNHLNMERETLLHLYTRLGRTLEIAGRYEQAIEHYQALELRAKESKDREMELVAILSQATIFSTLTGKMDLDKGRLLGVRSLELARKVGDLRAETKALWNLMLVEGMNPKRKGQAIAYGEQALAIARANHFEEELAFTLHDLARTYAQMGRLAIADKPMAEAVVIWRKLDNKPMLADSLAWSASMKMIRGDFTQAAALGEEGLSLSRKIGNPWNQSYNLIRLAPVYFERGEFGRALLTLQDSIAIGQEANFLGGIVMGEILLAYLLARCGMVERGFPHLSSALSITEEVEAFLDHTVRMQAVEGLLHLFNDGIEQAAPAYNMLEQSDSVQPYDVLAGPLPMLFRCEYAHRRADFTALLGHSEESLAEMRTQGISFYMPDLMCYRGMALHALGREGALDALEKALQCAEGQGSRRSMLSIVPAILGHPRVQADENRASMLRSRAREVVEFIDQDLRRMTLEAEDNSPQQEVDLMQELRSSFAGLPEVQRA